MSCNFCALNLSSRRFRNPRASAPTDAIVGGSVAIKSASVVGVTATPSASSSLAHLPVAAVKADCCRGLGWLVRADMD